jgi:hypothetical protein
MLERRRLVRKGMGKVADKLEGLQILVQFCLLLWPRLFARLLTPTTCAQAKTPEQFQETQNRIAQTKKTYYQANRARIQDISAKYYEENAATRVPAMRKYAQVHRGPQTRCECGGTYINRTKRRHMKSKKHLDFVDAGKS